MQTLPTPRLPGAAGSGVTSGQYDTVILDRPNASVTVTLSTGTHNIRKLYMRETLHITGGSLAINYLPSPDSTPNSAQFSGPVSLSGGSLSVHTLQVDATRIFTLGGGTLTLNKINLMPHASSPAKMRVTGDVTINPLADAAAVIANGTGTGTPGRVDLGGAVRAFNVGNGFADADLTVSTPIINGGLTKQGAGTLALTGANTYSGDTSVEAGQLRLTSAFLANGGDVRLATGGLLDLPFTGSPDVIDSLFIDGVSMATGTWGAEGTAAQFTSPLITGTGFLEVTTFVPPPSPADFNGDGFVDATDMGIWEGGFETAGNATPQQGDADGDLDVDGADFLKWQQELSVPAAAPAGAAIPEPAAATLVFFACAVLRRRAR
jgi:autotransporter-associated beta strand protein